MACAVCVARMVWLAWAVALWVPLGASAQSGGDSMGQGEALINVRSDVKLGIKGTGGTTSEHLQQLADAIAVRMPDVRACYGKLVAQRPATVGALAVRLTLERGVAAPTLEVKEKDGSDPELAACVREHLAKGSFAQVGRPAAVIVSLEFQNSRAQGQVVMQAHRAKADALPVKTASDGSFEATWARSNGDVSFTVRGASSPAVESVARDFRDHVALWVDCRRRASKGQSPGGIIKVDVRIQAGGALDASVRSAATEQISRCVDKTFKGRVVADAPAGQRVSVDITFAP